MSRANRHYLPGYIWHITHLCHQRAFLLRFKQDRQLWRRWLFEARRRYGLRVLNYMATCNHIHLLVRDRGDGEIARAMKLVAGRTAQTYNGRKHRRGAFWEDRYHATAVESGEHLRRCMVYMDLNMVRAGQVAHPKEWDTCGYHEIQSPRIRYRIIDTNELMLALGINDPMRLKQAHQEWVAEALNEPMPARQKGWSEGLAVGSPPFLAGFQRAQGGRARHRSIEAESAGLCLRDVSLCYSALFDDENPPPRD